MKQTACTLSIDQNLQRHHAVSPWQLGFLVWLILDNIGSTAHYVCSIVFYFISCDNFIFHLNISDCWLKRNARILLLLYYWTVSVEQEFWLLCTVDVFWLEWGWPKLAGYFKHWYHVYCMGTGGVFLSVSLQSNTTNYTYIVHVLNTFCAYVLSVAFCALIYLL